CIFTFFAAPTVVLSIKAQSIPGGGKALTIRVQYHNDVYDIVSSCTLQRFIAQGKIQQFYRYSEKRWIIIGSDPIRNAVDKGARMLAPYFGPERRVPQIFDAPFSVEKIPLPAKESLL
ncbi:MAG TPA: hypothetical protein VMB78_00005, partial [Dissulfurispiraceae bacterium]|nr:hypothetical protein [Dissulfurispiraceae bacterium]